MNTFKGVWRTDASWGVGVVAQINESNNIVTAFLNQDLDNPFPGFEVDLYAATLSVDFGGDRGQLTGVFSSGKILWSDGSIWTIEV